MEEFEDSEIIELTDRLQAEPDEAVSEYCRPKCPLKQCYSQKSPSVLIPISYYLM